MPTFSLKRTIVFLGLLAFYFSGVTTPALALTGIQYATASATATVPATPVDSTDTTPPTNPILIRPTDGSHTGDNKPEFVWRQSSDPNGNTVVYTMYLNGVATFLGISNTSNSAGNGYAARVDGSEIKLLPASALLDGSYTWYVTASDPSGNTSSSTTWNFTIDTVAPHILISDIDIYHDLILDSDHPENFSDTPYEIAGPKDVYFTINAESWSTVTLQHYEKDGNLVAQSSWPVNNTGRIMPYQHLAIGTYKVIVSAFDRGGNTTALPDIYLNITQSQISLSLPPIPGLPANYVINYAPFSFGYFPATVAHVSTRLSLSTLMYSLLAVALGLLLLFLWKNKYNLILLDKDGKPHEDVVLYHSIPTTISPYTHVYATKSEPISYTMSAADHGRLHIRHLGRYSTMTIRIAEQAHILSISAKRSVYTIIL